MKAQRQHTIERILADHQVTSQGHLVELLAEAGFEATQATVSRDLEELGAVKVRVPGGDSIYAVPELAHQRQAPDDHLRRVFSDWVVEVAANPPLIVLRTPPGSAHVVGSALDRSGRADIIGTVAGDDTILVVVAPDATCIEVAGNFRDLAGL
ncbi:MAG: arginine repressor [Actinomycetia bacterium]|nr:arginine repressor [Actinomycetes bacterium]MCP4963246.1 arginine repressor [Actinomycetes bacterium]